ncbi:unnamed protein product [Sphagnum tenellum]
MNYLSCGLKTHERQEGENRPISKIGINGLKCRALFDSGSQVTLLSWAVFTRLKVRPSLNQIEMKLNAANGSSLEVLGETNLLYNLAGYECLRPTIIVKGLKMDSIIGQDMMSAEGVKLDARTRSVIFQGPIRTSLICKKAYTIEPHSERYISTIAGEQILQDCVGIVEESAHDGLISCMAIAPCALKIQARKPIPVLITNSSDIPILLRRGLKVANMQVMDETLLQPNMSSIRSAVAMEIEQKKKMAHS